MAFLKRNTQRDENHICALCEFSEFKEDEIMCNGRRINPSGYCKRFIFDPRKATSKRQTVSDRDFDFPSLD